MNARGALALAAVIAAPASAHAQASAAVPEANQAAFGVVGSTQLAVRPRQESAAALPAMLDPRTVRSPWLLAIDTQATWLLDPRSATFQRDPGAVSGPGFSIGRDLVSFHRTGALQLGIVFAYAATEGLVAQTVATHLEVIQLGIDATLRIPWLSWLTPHVRAGAGSLMLDTRVAGATGDALGGSAWSALGTLGAGLTVHTPAGTVSANHPSAILGLRMETGYLFGMPASMDVQPPSPADATASADRIAVQPTHLGTILPHGPYVRISFVIRF